MLSLRTSARALPLRWYSSAAKEKVLILCTGNSCRSHMAEGLVNAMLGERYTALSAGTKPSGYVHPLAIEALEEIGININAHTSKHTDEVKADDYAVTVTVCGNAQENQPEWLQNHTHLPFVDPADATGTKEEQMQVFREVRDQIREQLIPMLQQREQAASSA